MNTVLWGILAYLLVQFGIGIYVSRRIKTESDYIVAGRRLGYGLATGCRCGCMASGCMRTTSGT